jgi:hypothetical protein
MFDLNDVVPIQSGELIPDGTFAKVTMALRPGGIDGFTEIDKGLVRLLVERVDLAPDGMQVRLRADGLHGLVEELQSREARAA